MDGTPTGDATLIARHQAAKKRLMLLRILFPLAILTIVIGYIFSIVNQVQNVDMSVFIAELEAKANVLLPRVQEHMEAVANNLRPVLEEELKRQSRVIGPKLDRLLDKETKALKIKLEEDFERELISAVEEIEERQRRILVTHIPELKGDAKAQDRVLETMRVSLLKWCMRQLTHTFHHHMLAMDKIRHTLQKSYLVKNEEGTVQPQEMLMIWLELMNENLGGDDTILAGKGLDSDPEKPASKEKR
jgi:hypothetical protein